MGGWTYEYSKHQLSGQKHLNNCEALALSPFVFLGCRRKLTKTPRNRSTTAQRSRYVEFAREQRMNHGGGSNRPQNLRDKDQTGANPSDSTNKRHTKRNSRVKKTYRFKSQPNHTRFKTAPHDPILQNTGN